MSNLTRILRAIDFIEDNLFASKEENMLAIENVAKIAAFSPWHFQRIFISITGERVAGHIRRRRLSHAWSQVTESRTGLLHIALDCGYESQESFTRAFSAHFGMTPGKARRTKPKIPTHLLKLRISHSYLNFINRERAMQPRMIQLEQTKVVGYGSRFVCIMSSDQTATTVIPPLWTRLLCDLSRIPNRKGSRTIGYCIPFERLGESCNHADECYYMACVEVENDPTAVPGMEVRDIPPGRYAVFTHKGKLDKLEHTLRYIYGTWVSETTEQLRDAPDLEVYDERFNENSDDSELDLYIPIK